MTTAYNPRLPIPPNDTYQKDLHRDLIAALRDLGTRLDLLAAGALSGARITATTIPTTGRFAAGDFIRKSNPVEAGAVASKYVVTGWVCTTGGPAGTFIFRESRTLTGN